MLAPPVGLPPQLAPLLNGSSRPAGAPRPKKYHVLGDVREFAEKLAASIPVPPPPEPDNVDKVDPAEFPEDIWSAAGISPDRGVAVIAAYREVHKAREQYQAQLDMIYNTRAAHADATGVSSGRGMGATLPEGPSPASAMFGGRTTITQQMMMGKEPRKLDMFERQQVTWNTVTANLVATSQRPPNDLAINRGAEWRQKAETLNMLERVVPMEERGLGGPERWNMSLRNAWERVVPLGSPFGGLYVTIRDQPPSNRNKDILRIGVPDLQAPAAPISGHYTSSTASASPVPRLTQGQAAPGLAKALSHAALTGNLRHSPSPPPLGAERSNFTAAGTVGGNSARPVSGLSSAPDTLVGAGIGMQQPRSLMSRERTWAHGQYLAEKAKRFEKDIRSLAPHDVDFSGLAVRGEPLETQLLQLAYAPISLSEVESHMATHNPDAFHAYLAVKQQLLNDLEEAALAARAQREAEAAAIAAAGPQPGPHAELSSPHVLLAAVAGEVATASFHLRHRGTAAFQYEWRRRDPVRPPGATAEIGGAAAGGAQRFYLSQQAGALLPGQTTDFSFTFKSPQAGTFGEEWVLVTHPVLVSGTLTLTVRGMATAEDLTAVPRAALVKDLQQREKMTKVRAALERVLFDVQLPPQVAPVESAWDSAEADAFFSSNAAIWPPTYYSSAQSRRLREVYNTARAELLIAQAPPPEDPKEAKKKALALAKEAKASKGSGPPPPPPPPPPPRWPEQWDGRLHILDELVAELDSTGPEGAASAAGYGATLAVVRAEALVPEGPRRIVQHAMRTLVLRAVEAVDVKLASVREDYQVRLSEQRGSGHGKEHRLSGGGDADSSPLPAVSAAAAAAAPDPPAATPGPRAPSRPAPSTTPGAGHRVVPELSMADSRPSSQRVVGHSGSLAAVGTPGRVAPSPLGHGGVDGGWYVAKCKSAVKVILRNAVGTLSDELDRERAAIGDALEEQLRVVDERLAVLDAGRGGAGQGGRDEAGYGAVLWERFAVLRRWVQLGVPARGDIR